MQRVQELSEALKRLFGMDEEDAREITTAVMDAFGGDDEIPDDRLDADLRSIFYTLEAKKLLGFRRVDGTTDTGERRRAFYWRLRVEAVERVIAAPDPAPEMDVYASLPAAAWHRASRAA